MKVERKLNLEQMLLLRQATALELGPKQQRPMQLWMMVKIATMKSTTSNRLCSCRWRLVKGIKLMQREELKPSQRPKSLN